MYSPYAPGQPRRRPAAVSVAGVLLMAFAALAVLAAALEQLLVAERGIDCRHHQPDRGDRG
jgi:hypothetical protein